MKRYLLFYGARYYPIGGMDDFQGSFDTIEEAKKAYLESDNERDYSWADIFDLIQEKIILRADKDWKEANG